MEAFGYHVVTDRPVHVGQRIVFDENNHSRVWRRVHNRADEVARIYTNPNEFASQELDHHLAVAAREIALEEVRVTEFPSYPSRLNSLYVSVTLEDAEAWSVLFVDRGRPTYQIVRLRTDGDRFVGDARNCFTGTTNRSENLRRAERYWLNLPNPYGEPPIVEVLVGGRIEVVEILREVGANLPWPKSGTRPFPSV